MTHARLAVFGVAALFFALVLVAPRMALARDVPPLTSRVVDTIGLLPADATVKLEQRLAAYEQSSGHQFAVLAIDTLAGDALEPFSIRVVEAWKLGKKGKDDGLLLLIVRDDRKVRIEVGYGLEGDITDAFSSRVIRNIMTPAFRSGDYANGVEKALEALMQKASGENVQIAEPVTAPAPPPPGGLGIALLGLFFVVPFLLPLLFFRRRGRGRFIGGLPGALGGFGSNWGGFSSGGGFSGGGGGGFSGGGGSFGGGGASGSW